jgi:hypothetical protein
MQRRPPGQPLARPRFERRSDDRADLPSRQRVVDVELRGAQLAEEQAKFAEER